MGNLYAQFSQANFANDDNYATVINCLVHMLSIDKIDIRKFEIWLQAGGIGGDVACGIEKWNRDSAIDHDIHESYEGYLFYIGTREYGTDEKEYQKILTNEEIKPFIHSIISYYLKIDKNNKTNVYSLIQLARDYGMY